MGDWATTHHWFECESSAQARRVLARLHRAATRYRWLDSERWALRAGLCGPEIVLAASLTKYGADLGLAEFVCEVEPALRVLQACPGYDLFRPDAALRGLGPRFNYVRLPPGVDGTDALDLLGAQARLQDAGDGRVLCLREPVTLPLKSAGRLAELSLGDSGLARVSEALALGERGVAGHRTTTLLGLRSPQHGWLHLGSLTLGLTDDAWEHSGWYALRHDGGEHQPLTAAFCVGPYAGSIYFEPEPPIDLSRVTWPFGQA